MEPLSRHDSPPFETTSRSSVQVASPPRSRLLRADGVSALPAAGALAASAVGLPQHPDHRRGSDGPGLRCNCFLSGSSLNGGPAKCRSSPGSSSTK